MDETLSSMASKLEHSAQAFPELQGERMVSLHCCALYTCAQLENGLYWWWVEVFNTRIIIYLFTLSLLLRNRLNFTCDLSLQGTKQVTAVFDNMNALKKKRINGKQTDFTCHCLYCLQGCCAF